MSRNDAGERIGNPVQGSLKTHYSPNSRAKCKLCNSKVAKGAWRIQLSAPDMHGPPGMTTWQSAHAACYLINVTKPIDLSGSTQSMPYYGAHPSFAWSNSPILKIPPTAEGEAITAALVVKEIEDTLDQVLPTEALRVCFSAAVTDSIPGSETLDENDRTIFELVCLHRQLNSTSRNLLRISETEEATTVTQPEDNSDPLKSKFTQLSPNS